MKTESKNPPAVGTYGISISADGIWSGDGIYEQRETDGSVSGDIRDCAAILGGSQAAAEKIYALIVDAITEMDVPGDGGVEVNGSTYEWTLGGAS